MKRKVIGLLGSLLLIMICMGFHVTAHADEEKQLLFCLKILTGEEEQKVPVYEISDGSVKTIAAGEKKNRIYIGRNNSEIAISITDKTAYFENNYSSVSISKKVRVRTSVAKKLKVVLKSGKTLKCRLCFLDAPVPSVKSVKLASSEIKIPEEALNAVIRLKNRENITCRAVIRNSRRKKVFIKTIGTGVKSKLIFTWDGTASKGNKAGYATSEMVDEGSYTLRIYLYYKDGSKKRKAVSEWIPFTVEYAAAEPAGEVNFENFNALNTWQWNTMITDDPAADYLAEYVCQQILKPGMSEYKRIRAIHKYCVLHYTRRGGTNTSAGAADLPELIDISSQSAKKAIKAYRQHVAVLKAQGKAVVNNLSNCQVGSRIDQIRTAISKQTGDCLNMAFKMEALCRHAGLYCDILENGLPNSHPLHHFFVAVKVDGNWYICDPRIENARLDGTRMTWTHFLRGRKNLTVGGDDDVRYSSIKDREKYNKTFALLAEEDYRP